jgi:hypothetical protein
MSNCNTLLHSNAYITQLPGSKGEQYPSSVQHFQQQQQQQQQQAAGASPLLQSQQQQQQQQQGGAGGLGALNEDPSKNYSLMGLLRVIRMTDPDLNMLALGSDLTTLGLNLDSSEVCNNAVYMCNTIRAGFC